MEKISPEKKMELIKTIREENERNKGRIRTREQILFGTETELTTMTSLSGEEINSKENSVSSLKIRFLLAALLFVGFLLLDSGRISERYLSAAQIQAQINQPISVNLFDFIAKFPYTLKEEMTMIESQHGQ